MPVEKQRTFSFDLRGRIRNLSMPPSQIGSLLPIFEALSNSIHAIETRFGNESAAMGKISIEIVRAEGGAGNPIGFRVRDNGIGMNDANMDSFCVSDTTYKAEKGGKGVGRLSWLKAFQACNITSTFEEDGEKWSRTFKFSLERRNGNYHLSKAGA